MPCLPGVPNNGDKIRIGYPTLTFSGAHTWVELLATSDFVPFVGDPRELRGYLAIPPSFGSLRRQG